jgi:hypothetical protein
VVEEVDVEEEAAEAEVEVASTPLIGKKRQEEWEEETLTLSKFLMMMIKYI